MVDFEQQAHEEIWGTSSDFEACEQEATDLDLVLAMSVDELKKILRIPLSKDLTDEDVRVLREAAVNKVRGEREVKAAMDRITPAWVKEEEARQAEYASWKKESAQAAYHARYGADRPGEGAIKAGPGGLKVSA